MKPNEKFLKLKKDFWANIRSISQQTGYTVRGKNQIKVPSIEDIKESLTNLQLSYEHLIQKNDQPTDLGFMIIDYYKYRAEILNNFIEPLLMDVDEVLFGKEIIARLPIIVKELVSIYNSRRT